MNKLVTLDFCTVEIHDSYLKAIMNEGITVDVLESNQIINLAKECHGREHVGFVDTGQPCGFTRRFAALSQTKCEPVQLL